MNNVFQAALPVTKQYDLKGSTLGRTSRGEGGGGERARAGSVVLKDLDLDIRLKLEEGWHDRCVPARASVSHTVARHCCCCMRRAGVQRQRSATVILAAFLTSAERC